MKREKAIELKMEGTNGERRIWDRFTYKAPALRNSSSGTPHLLSDL